MFGDGVNFYLSIFEKKLFVLQLKWNNSDHSVCKPPFSLDSALSIPTWHVLRTPPSSLLLKVCENIARELLICTISYFGIFFAVLAYFKRSLPSPRSCALKAERRFIFTSFKRFHIKTKRNSITREYEKAHEHEKYAIIDAFLIFFSRGLFVLCSKADFKCNFRTWTSFVDRRGDRGARKETNENRKGGERNDRYRIKRRLVERLRFVFVFFCCLLVLLSTSFSAPGKMLLSIAVCFLLWAWTFRLNSVLSLFANLSEKYIVALSTSGFRLSSDDAKAV